MPNITINGTILLPPDMKWEDEHNTSLATRKIAYSVTGALIVQTAKKKAGRRFTLSSGNDTAWLTRTQVEALKALEETDPTSEFELKMPDNTTFNVMFGDADPIQAENVQPGKFKAATDRFRATIKFIGVPA